MTDPFNPTDGEFAKNIRSTTDDDLTELRESMQKFGWIKEFPALVDEYGVVLVGHRRIKIAQELGIESIMQRLTLGKGEAADAERFKLAIASNIGHKPMTKEDRQRIAKYLYGEREWTMQQIADALSVTQKTISKDLAGVYTQGINPARPQGGRPKGSTRITKARKNTDDAERLAASLVLDKGLSYEKAAEEAGIDGSVQIVKIAIAREEGRREPVVNREDLSLTALQKLEIAIRQAKRKLDLEYKERVRLESRKLIEEVILPSYIKDHEMYKEVIRSRKGIIDRSVYRKILSCLHPDRVTDPSLKRRYEDAFNLFTKMEKLLLSEKDSPTAMTNLPRTYEEMMELKRKVAEERRAARMSKSKSAVHRG
jgi:ParB-like chromosome segregation protein Spo0J